MSYCALSRYAGLVSEPELHATKSESHHIAGAEARENVLTGALGTQHRKPPWQIFLESAGGAALITVIFGGVVASIVGQSIAHRYQAELKKRETAVAAYNAYMADATSTVTGALDVIGRLLAASDGLIRLSDFYRNAVARHEGEAAVKQKRETVIHHYETTLTTWRAEREPLSLQIMYYHQANEEITAAWLELRADVDAYAKCTEEGVLYGTTGGPPVPEPHDEKCGRARISVDRSLARFILARRRAARQLANEAWDLTSGDSQ